MSKDLDIITQLQKRIGKKLPILGKIDSVESLGYQLNKQEQVTTLSLYDCKLGTLPPEIVRLQNLVVLNLSHNQISHLPPEIGELQGLTGLNLPNNQLSYLPPEIGRLQKLIVLYLYENRLSNLPSEIASLQSLKVLNLMKNQFKQFPKVLLALNLEIRWDFFIEVEDDRFPGIPIQQWSEEGILVGDNSFQTPPAEIVEQGRQVIIDYYNALESR